MLFLNLCTLAMFVAGVRILRLLPLLFMMARRSTDAVEVIAQALVVKKIAVSMALDVLPAFLIALPVILGMPKISPHINTNILVVFCLLGALLLLAIVIVRGLRSRHGNPNFWFVGWLVLSTLTASVAVVASVKHLAFFTGDEQNGTVYVIAPGGLEEKVKDMHCDSRVVVARWVSLDGPVTYRCPTTVAVFSIFSNAPFVPWPDYTEGTSADLAVVLRELSEQP